MYTTYKTYILPILEYGCELWDNCCVRDTEKLERLQLEAARIVTGTGLPIYTNIESLYFETGWEKLSERRKFRKLNLFYKIQNNMAPQYLIDCMPTTVGETMHYSLRNADNYNIPRCRLQTFSKSFFPSTLQLWNSLPASIRSLPTISRFKSAMREPLVHAPSFYAHGTRKLNILHTKLRYRCSPLNADLFRVNLKMDPSCLCGHPFEDAIHFFLECPLYQIDRNILIDNINNIVPFTIEYLLFGCDNLSDELNLDVFKSVHKFIRHTCRFDY